MDLFNYETFRKNFLFVAVKDEEHFDNDINFE